MGKSVLKQIKQTVFKKVRDILHSHPDARNDDRLLCVLYWKLIDGVTDLDGVQFATTPEVIRRARQKLNERGLFLATDPEVLKRRRQNAVEMQQGISNF